MRRAVVGGPGRQVGGQGGRGGGGRVLEEGQWLQAQVLVQEGGGQGVLLQGEEAHLRERGGGGVLVVAVGVGVVPQGPAGAAREGPVGRKTYKTKNRRKKFIINIIIYIIYILYTGWAKSRLTVVLERFEECCKVEEGHFEHLRN